MSRFFKLVTPEGRVFGIEVRWDRDLMTGKRGWQSSIGEYTAATGSGSYRFRSTLTDTPGEAVGEAVQCIVDDIEGRPVVERMLTRVGQVVSEQFLETERRALDSRLDGTPEQEALVQEAEKLDRMLDELKVMSEKYAG